MDSDEDDPVVQEIDVFLCKQLAEHLYVFQYPVHPAHLPYDGANHLSARIKPRQQKVELEVAMNTQSPNYAGSKGEQIALNVDGADPGEDAYYRAGRMDKQVLSSSPVGVNTGRYVIGLYRDGELHLTPLKGVIQLRPSFAYMDKGDKLKAEIGAVIGGGAGDDAAAGESSQDEQDEPKQVTIKFARHETDDAKARRMASYEYLRSRQEEESWVDVTYRPRDHPVSYGERQLLASHAPSEGCQFHLGQDDYLRRLIPRLETQESSRPALPNNVLSMAELKNMSLNDQVKALLTSAKVIRFSQLLSLLPKGSDAATVLRYVQQVALLVQGCWVVKSEILHPKDTFSAYSAVPAETLCRGRDYIMWRFIQSRYLVRKDIASVIKLPAEDVKDILEQMARLKVNKGWEFLMDCDTEFINRHVEVVQRQHMLWDAKFQQLSKVLNISKSDLKMAAHAASQATAATSPRRRRTTSRSRTKSGGERSFSDFSDTDGEMKPDRQRRVSGSLERKRNQSGGRQRKTSGCVADVAEAAEAVTGSSSLHAANGTGNQVAARDVVTLQPIVKSEVPSQSDSVVEKCKPVDPSQFKVELLQFAAEKLRSRVVLNLGELRRLLNLKMAENVSGHVLGAGVSNKALEQAAIDVGGCRMQPTSASGEPIFVMRRLGDAFDYLRETIVDMLLVKPSVKTSVLRKKLDDHGQDIPPDGELKRVLKEYCVTRGSTWYLKGMQEQS